MILRDNATPRGRDVGPQLARPVRSSGASILAVQTANGIGPKFIGIGARHGGGVPWRQSMTIKPELAG